jgi:membrane protein insertase Oxa1/YidC/SpoIIIJ
MIRSVTRTAGSRRVFSRSTLGKSSALASAAVGRQRVAPIGHLQVNPWNESGKFRIGISSLDRRFFSATSSSSGDESDVGGSLPSVDETLDKLFAENSQGASDALQAAADVWSPTWYNIADQAVVVIHNFQDFTGLEYGWAIVGVTFLMRIGLFPLMIASQRTSSRMAHLQPELNQMKARYEALGTPSRQDQMQFGTKIKALFKRFEVQPMKAFIAPAAQLPLFMGMFFGLKKMPGIYPEEFAVGGILWFPDLTVSDPYFALPILSSLT